MLAYLAAGAAICGEPALDPVFKTIDFLTWMDLQTMPARVLRKFAG
jgi:putative hemolysin